MNLEKLQKVRTQTCNGCGIFNDFDVDNVCAIPHRLNGHDCPCSTCLVKGMCKTTCDLIHSYAKVKCNRLVGTRYYRRGAEWWTTSDPKDKP